ncbi:MAG: ABC transporter permease [Verrucomicrobiota bacterium]
MNESASRPVVLESISLFDFTKVWALLLRYNYLYRRSPPRLLEIIFWPVMDLLVWGFLTSYLKQGAVDVPGAVTFLIGGMILWDVLYRSQQGVSLSFMEDMWSHNLINVFAAPVRVREFLMATYGVGFIKVFLVTVVLGTMSVWFYDFALFSLGSSLLPLFANLLILGWSMGMLTTGLILRFGHAAQALAWGIPFLLMPLSAVFYPVAVLPAWLQPVAWCLPSSHVFEGMRAVMNGGGFPTSALMWATGLNVVYAVVASCIFAVIFRTARKKGLLNKIGTR